MLRLGKIHPGTIRGPGECCPCSFFRALNDAMIHNRDSVPILEDFLTYIHGKTIFSKHDLVRAYHQIPFHLLDVLKIAMTTQIVLFELMCTPFRLRNALQTIGQILNGALRE